MSSGSTETVDLAQELRSIIVTIARRMRRDRPMLGLSLTQISALGSIERSPPVTPGELSERENLQPPSMSRVLARLEERGLIARTRDPDDGRLHLLRPTEKGQALMEEVRSSGYRWMEERLAKLSEAERDSLQSAIDLLTRIYGEDSG